MVRVGRRPCPNFPTHCFYILTNRQISMEQPQTRRPRLTRLTWFPKIRMATESSKIKTERLKNQLTTLNKLRSLKMSLMSLQFSQCVQPVQVEGQGQTRTRSHQFPLTPMQYSTHCNTCLILRMRSNWKWDLTKSKIKPRTRLRLNAYRANPKSWTNKRQNKSWISLDCS